jgi:hypothetical protein
MQQPSHQTLEDPYMEKDFDALLASWIPVASTMNELNRSLGLSDAYPFELTRAVQGKLHFVHMAILNFYSKMQIESVTSGASQASASFAFDAETHANV